MGTAPHQSFMLSNSQAISSVTGDCYHFKTNIESPFLNMLLQINSLPFKLRFLSHTMYVFLFNRKCALVGGPGTTVTVGRPYKDVDRIMSLVFITANVNSITSFLFPIIYNRLFILGNKMSFDDLLLNCLKCHMTFTQSL